MRARLTELRCGILYVLRPRLCALKDLREALIVSKFGIIEGAKVMMKELKPAICHELDDRLFRTLLPRLRSLPIIFNRNLLINSYID